jgi:hypothetical protein
MKGIVSTGIATLSFGFLLSGCLSNNESKSIYNDDQQDSLKKAAMEVCSSVADKSDCEPIAEDFSLCEGESCVSTLESEVKQLLVDKYGEEEGMKIYTENLEQLKEKLQGAEVELSMATDPVVLEAKVVDGGIFLSWNQYTGPGFEGYKVVWSEENEKPVYPTDGYLSYQPEISDTTHFTKAKAKKNHFGITILTKGKKVYTNWVTLEVAEDLIEEPKTEEEKKFEVVSESKPKEIVEEKLETEEKENLEECDLTQEISLKGELNEANEVSLKWNIWNCEAGFNGYKVVYSNTKENPIYPEDGYVKYISDRNTTTFEEPFRSEKGYYSITVLQEDEKIPSNSIQFGGE